jgi:hypothetical protein
LRQATLLCEDVFQDSTYSFILWQRPQNEGLSEYLKTPIMKKIKRKKRRP